MNRLLILAALALLLALGARDAFAAPLGSGDSPEVAALLPTPDAGVTVAEQDESIEIRSVKIDGLQNLSEDVVLASLTLRPGDVLVGNYTETLNTTAEALYDSGWFRSRPDITPDPLPGGGVELNVTVQENPTYKGSKITGNTLFSEDRLLQEVEGVADAEGNRSGGVLAPGEVINARRIVEAIDNVLGVYQAAGYVGVQVENYQVTPAGPDEGVVEIALSEGVLEEIIIRGNTRTREGVIRNQITHLTVGQVLRRDDIERDLNQIYNTGLFETVDPTLEPSVKPGNVRVAIDVTEGPTGQAGVGLGYSTVNGLQGTLSYNEKNMFGSGKTVDAQVIFSNNQPGFELNFSDPYSSRRGFWSAGIFNLHSRQQRFPGQPYESELQIDTQGFNAAYGERINDNDSWQTAFSVTDYDYEIRKGDPFRSLTPRQRARLSAKGETRKVGLSFAHDTRDNKFDTTEGFLGTGTAELAGLGGDFNFNKYTFETREFHKVGPGTLAMRQKLGTSTGSLPIYEEYRLGGVNSIRGVSEDLLTGSASLLTNFEYRYRLNEMFGVVGFFDSGWAGESLASMKHAAGAGVGARIKVRALGIGAVRLDYGWELAGDPSVASRFHFFLGEMF